LVLATPVGEKTPMPVGAKKHGEGLTDTELGMKKRHTGALMEAQGGGSRKAHKQIGSEGGKHTIANYHEKAEKCVKRIKTRN